MSSKQGVIKNAMFYTFGNLLLKAFSFFLIPLYTGFLSPEEYGVLNLSIGFTSVISMLLMLGLQYAVIRFYADYKEEQDKVARMFGSVVTLISCLGIALSILLIIFRNFWAPFFFENLPFTPIVFLSIIIAVVQGLYTVYQDMLKGMQEARRSIILTYIFFFLLLGSNIYTVVYLKLGATGILLSTMFVHVVMLVLMFVDLIKRKLFICTIDTSLIKELLKYSLPLVPHSIAYTISNYITRLVISSKLSLSTLGIYSLSSQFGGLGDIILNSIQSAFQPWMFERLNKSNNICRSEISSLSYMLMWVYGLFFILVAIFSQEAVILMANEDYIDAWIYVPALIASISIKSPLYFYNNFLYYDKIKTRYLFTTSVIGSILCILFTWLLVPNFGIYGAVLASIIGMFVRLIFTLKHVYNEGRLFYSFWKLELLSVIPILFIIIGLLPSLLIYDNFISYINIIYKLLIIGVYIIIFLLIYRNNLVVLLKRYKER